MLSFGLLSVTLAACSGQSSPTIPADAVRIESAPLSVPPARLAELERIDEAPPADTRRVWLKKDFWLKRRIFLSLGVERASVTGLATSVMGYLPATLKQAGNTLVLERDPKGLFGGSVLPPEITINAYPILAERETEILIDLAAPKTPYGLSLMGQHAGPNASAEFQPRLEYTKKVEVGESSVSYTNVATLKAPQALFDPKGDSAEAAAGMDPFLLSLTLRVDWVVTSEDTDLATLASSATNALGFFLSDPLATDGGTKVARFVQRIRLSRPFEWRLSASTPEGYRASVEAGLTAWNAPLGHDVIRVKTADAARSVVDPSASNLIWDDNRAVGMAFANWRTNPYTGEILQAQIYMSGDMWASQAATTYKLRAAEQKIRDARAAAAKPAPVATGAPAPTPAAVTRLNLPRLTPFLTRERASDRPQGRLIFAFNSALALERAKSDADCVRTTRASGVAEHLLEIDAEPLMSGGAVGAIPAATSAPEATHLPYVPAGMKIDEFQRAIIRGVVMHEAGHTLGLRHNFRGSLSTSEGVESGSVMDYNDLVVDAAFTGPGTLDFTTIRAGYTGAAPVGEEDFCTDEDADKAPDCFRFDGFKRPEEFFRVKQESELLVAQRLAVSGFTANALELVVSSLKSTVPLIEMLLSSAEDDAAFALRQARALKIFASARTLQGIAWPEATRAEYEGLLIQLLAANVNPDAERSAAIPELCALLQEVVANVDGKWTFPVRKSALEGLRKLQSARGRLSVRMAMAQLSRKVEAATVKANSEGFDASTGSALMEDEDLLQSIRAMLEAGYFKFAKDSNS